MIALTVSDLTDADEACLRIAELSKKKDSLSVPDAICIRNDSFSEETFAAMTELAGKLWSGMIVLETDEPANAAKAVVSVMDRRPLIIGACESNLEQFALIARMFDCPMAVSSENIEILMDLSARAEDLGVKDIVLDPMMRNMKQCLETCTDLERLSGMIPEAKHPIAVRTWSGEYAMSMSMVSMLVCDPVIIADDLDTDCCETLSELISCTR